MRLINPDGLPRAVGFSHVALPEGGEPFFLAGQTGHHADGSLDEGLVAQFGAACRNVGIALAAAGAKPADVASMQILVTDVDDYRASLSDIGEVYRTVFGRHFPAMTLVGVRELFDPKAVVEIVVVGYRPRDNEGDIP
ncbi:MAG TPA: RidA family protein [Acidimicrobiia bacterium]|jgi:enamine deaminase RidA (YjgF/YER057c/UK114 family)